MELEFSPEQEAIREGVRRVLGRECDTRVVRAAMVDGSTTSESLFATVRDLGWLMTAIPEPYGGLESGYDTLCGIVEELGRSLAPIPFLSSIIAMEAVASFGSEAQRKSYLALLGSGERIGCLAWSESGGRACESAIDATVRNGRLSGLKSPVVDGGRAHLAVTVARGEGGEIGLFVVDLEAAGVTRSALTSLDPTRPQAKLVFDGAPSDRLEGANGWADIQYILDRAAILVAFEQL